MIQPQKRETTNMTSLMHQRYGEQDKPSHRDQGKSLEWEDRKKDEFP